MNSVIFNTLSLVFAIAGVCICWIPGFWGWAGLVMCLGAIVIGVRGMTDRKCPGGAVGMDIAGNIIGGFALPWGIAFQIKHAAGELDNLLIQMPLETLLYAAGGAVVLFWVAQIVGRFKARVLFVVITVLALAAYTVAGVSVWTYADREYTAETDDGQSAQKS